ncbi:MAG: hypothetical protein NWE86_00905 [Candidatus Bathyarchaeota archaeon]|nr:hypothetical protein [Candidatus Bathyarchaeota archaeon]
MLCISVVPVFAAGGFDQYGYNYKARIFNGLFGNSDENRASGDGDPDTFFGSTTDSYGFYDFEGNYHEVLVDVAGAHLVMKWSWAWHMAVFGPDNIRYNGDEEPWNEDAWCTNHVVGTGTIHAPDGSIIYQGKLTILSKIVWVGDTAGYTNPIWGQFAIVQKEVNGQGIHLSFMEIPPSLGDS